MAAQLATMSNSRLLVKATPDPGWTVGGDGRTVGTQREARGEMEEYTIF